MTQWSDEGPRVIIRLIWDDGDSSYKMAKSRDNQTPTGRLKKPKMVIKRGQEARDIHDAKASEPLTLWGIIIRFLPVWALIIMILVLAPTLPLQAARAFIDWVRVTPQQAAEPSAAEPVFVVEGGAVQPVDPNLPTPAWDTELATFFTPQVQYWADDIMRWAGEYRVEPNMIATLMQIESCGDPTAESPNGKLGLFQVPGDDFALGEDPFDPGTNAQHALVMFSEMLASANNDVGLAYAAYNGGIEVTEQSPSDWSAETQNYQFWGSGLYDEAITGFSDSPTLTEWLGRGGGSSLCSAASQALGLE